ncbi:MAG: winged helix-turn-helix domain-containing protein, partial [Paludibacteraceae bacterium]|nr:winged helix-turn-helix domain-containing protein [Paludibacteraceae bacterium]
LLVQMEKQGRIPQVPTHQELAIMVNLTRESVSRVFQLLQGRSIVERDGNDLILEDIGMLNTLADTGI